MDLYPINLKMLLLFMLKDIFLFKNFSLGIAGSETENSTDPKAWRKTELITSGTCHLFIDSTIFHAIDLERHGVYLVLTTNT